MASSRDCSQPTVPSSLSANSGMKMMAGWISVSITFIELKWNEDGTEKVQRLLILLEMEKTFLGIFFYSVDNLCVSVWGENWEKWGFYLTSSPLTRMHSIPSLF